MWVTELLCFKQEPITPGTDYWKGLVGRLSAESLKVNICTTLSSVWSRSRKNLLANLSRVFIKKTNKQTKAQQHIGFIVLKD